MDKNKDGFIPGQDLTLADILAMRCKPEDTPAPTALPSREDIASMKKADLVDWLEAHGVEKPVGTNDELRAALISIMFIEA